MNLQSYWKSSWFVPISIATAFVLWSSWFVYRTSFIIDGKRYFSLFDDAMISMRYAWNFSQGNGLVWNVGERIEGYTNLLMTLFMSVPNFFFEKPNAVLSVQIFGIIVMLSTAFLSVKISGRILRHRLAEYTNLAYALVALGVFGYYPLVYWSIMGMETGLLTTLVLCAVLFSLIYVDERSNLSLYLVALSLGLAFLTRNDSAIYAISVFAYLLISTVKPHAVVSNRIPLIMAVFIFMFFIGIQLAFRYLYYDQLLPNTYLLKVSGFATDLRIRNGIGYILPFIKETVVLVSLASISLISNIRVRRIFLLSLFVLAILYQIWNGGDPWTYWRFIAPTMPLIIILAIIAIVEMSSSLQGFISSGKFKKPEHTGDKGICLVCVVVIIVSALVVLIPANIRFGTQIFGLAKPYTVEDNETNVRTALAIQELTTEEATVGVFWAGSIPYYTGRRAVDFLGKSDEHIAGLDPDLSGAIAWNGMVSVPGHNKYDLSYSIQQLRPTYIQNVRWGKQDLSKWAKANYKLVNSKGVEILLMANSSDVFWEKVIND